MDQYFRFDKLGIIRTLQHRVNTMTTDTVARKTEEHIKKALSLCGYHSWTFFKDGKAPSKKLQERKSIMHLCKVGAF